MRKNSNCVCSSSVKCERTKHLPLTLFTVSTEAPKKSTFCASEVWSSESCNCSQQVMSGKKCLHRAHLKLPDDWLTRNVPVRNTLLFKNTRRPKMQSVVAIRRQHGSMSGLSLPVEVCVHKLRPYGYRDKARHSGKMTHQSNFSFKC